MQLTLEEIYTEKFIEICESAGLRFNDEDEDEERIEDEMEERELEEEQSDGDEIEDDQRTLYHQTNGDEHEELWYLTIFF